MMNSINLLAVGLSLALGFFLGVAYEHWRIGRKLDAVERRVNQIEAAIKSSDRS
jgi:hypothetical protein